MASPIDPEDPGTDPLLPAVTWLAGRLADVTGPGDPPPPATLDWGLHAGAHPPSYRHWLAVWDGYRTAHADLLPAADLPTDGPLFSVVVPVFRPLLWYFRECVASVLAQTYPHWQLCLCDDGSGDPELTAALAELAATDPRVVVRALDENGGISRATNEALAAATGEFTVLLDHDDVLVDTALAEVAAAVAAAGDADVVYSDEDKLDEQDRLFMPHFKPDWDPDLLLSYPYLGHLTVVRTELLRRIGGFRPEFDGSQDYDVMLRATEQARRVVHLPKVLYHWRVVAGSAAGDTDAKPWAHQASRRVVEDAVRRRGIDAEVADGPFPGAYHVRRRVVGGPTVSIIIPFRDQAALTVGCLDTLWTAPGHPIAEVVLVDNGSIEPETWALRDRLANRSDIRILDRPGPFNWAAINNAAARTCSSDLLLFLNNDVEADHDGWLAALVEQAQRPEVGAVGARLVFPDGSLQHAGVVIGLGGVASHLFMGMPDKELGYFSWDRVVRAYSAVTAACLLTRRQVFEEVGGFDEQFAVGFNDVDFCLRLGQSGYRVLYTPHAQLTHFESISRGLSGYYGDYRRFLARWRELLGREDPHYNPNLSRLTGWAGLRPPGEDEQWLELVDGLGDPDPAAASS